MVEGTVIQDFRGQEWLFLSLTRQPGEGKDGKVLVKDKDGVRREFYWSVFPKGVGIGSIFDTSEGS